MRKLENIVCKLDCPPIPVLREPQLSYLNYIFNNKYDIARVSDNLRCSL